MRAEVVHAPRRARGTDPAIFARPCDEELVLAALAFYAGEAVREIPALEVALEFVLDKSRQSFSALTASALAAIARSREKCFQVLLDEPI
jgi:hypothetical protein